MRSTLIWIMISLVVVALPAFAAVSIDEGKASFESGDYAAAASVFTAVLEQDADNSVALCYLGRIALAEEDFDLAIDRLEQAVELEPDDSMYRTWLGRAYIGKLQTVSFYEKGTFAGRALDQLEKAVKLDPSNIEARITLGGYYANAPSIAGGSKKKAREQAREVIKHDPVQGNAMMASVHIKNEEYDEAIEKLEFCIEADPEELQYRYQLGMVYQKLERYDDAFAVFEAVLTDDPENRAALYQIGRTAAFSGANADRGIECLEKYLTLEVTPGYPDYAGAHWRLGMIYEHKAESARARNEYETATRLNPESDVYRDALKKLATD